MTGTGAVPRQSATDLAYAAVKHGVLHGEYPGGELISEGEVSAAVGVSRTPVREAFLRLQAEGFLRLYPKRGALVVPVSVQEVDDVLEARLLVESFTVEKLISSGAASALDGTLTKLIAEQEELLDGAGLKAFADADRDFHWHLVSAAGNQIVRGLYDQLRDRQVRMSLAHVAERPARLRAAVEEHRAIAQALRDGDPVAARAAVRAHLEHTGDSLRMSRRSRP
ncbi:MAG: GntR family transcriptional regulator [Streptosporangiaceae bacterium]|nr:GntR family transcriptional regulator [Streptosporangiaceae bacterium]